MKSILLLFCLLSFGLVKAQSDHKIIIGTEHEFHSSILNENRRVLVYLPQGAMDQVFAQQHYPVLYLLDGDSHFFSVVGMIRQMSEEGGGIQFPPMMVVAILNTNRTRDLTPTHADNAYMLDSISLSYSGGGEHFMAFIEKELIPKIDSLYPTAPFRFFVGHSFGGLTVINTLINHPNLFNAYLAIDPSMSWDNQRLLKQAEAVLAKESFAGKSLFLAIANTMKKGMDTSTVRKDTAISSKHIQSILALAQALEINHQNGLWFDWKYYKDYNHGSVPLVAEYDAFIGMFRFYSLDFPYSQFFSPDFKDDSLVGRHFLLISQKMGYKISPPEPFVNFLGYQLMRTKQYARSARYFQMNIDNYPKSYNAYDSMGDLFEAKGDKKQAMAYFSRALALKEFPETREKLERLKAEENSGK